jgi:hypothetical protein
MEARSQSPFMSEAKKPTFRATTLEHPTRKLCKQKQQKLIQRTHTDTGYSRHDRSYLARQVVRHSMGLRTLGLELLESVVDLGSFEGPILKFSEDEGAVDGFAARPHEVVEEGVAHVRAVVLHVPVTRHFEILFFGDLTNISSYHHVIMSSYHHITISPYHHITISPYHHITISSYHHIIISPYHHIIIVSHIIVSYHHTTISSYHCIIISSYHHIIISPYHHIIISS